MTEWVASKTWAAEAMEVAEANEQIRDRPLHLKEAIDGNLYTNADAASHPQGTLVKLAATAGQVQRTTSAGQAGPIGVQVASTAVAANATGYYRFGDLMVQVLCTGAVAVGDSLQSSATAGTAVVGGTNPFAKAVGAQASGTGLVWAKLCNDLAAGSLTTHTHSGVAGQGGNTLDTPAIANFTNAAHDHGDADDGGALVLAALPAVPVVRLYHAANVSVPHAAYTTQPFDSEETDQDLLHFPSAANLTGTVSKTSGAATLVGVGTSFTTELSVGQVINIPGGAVEQFVVVAIADNLNATLDRNAANTASGQTATRDNSVWVCRQPGKYLIGGAWQCESNATGVRGVQLTVNGNIIYTKVAAAANGDVTVTDFAVPRILFLWDRVAMRVYQTNSGVVALNSQTNGLIPAFWGFYESS